MACSVCINSKNANVQNCFSCGSPLTDAMRFQISQLPSQDEMDAAWGKVLGGQRSDRANRDEQQVAKETVHRVLWERQQRRDSAKKEMDTLQLANFELLEDILEALNTLNRQGQKSEIQRGVTGMGIAAGLNALLNND